jgi:hypothetical protein
VAETGATSLPADVVGIEFEMSNEELEPVLRWQMAKIVRLRRSLLFAIPFLVLGVVRLVGPNLPGSARVLGIASLALVVFQSVLYLYIYVGAPRRFLRKRTPGSGRTRMEFTPDEVRIHTENSDVVNRWVVYSEMIDWRGVYLLRYGKGRAYRAIPKRAFASAEDERRFRSWAPGAVTVTRST